MGSLERFDTLILSLVIHEYVCLFRSSLISLYNALQCFLYRFYTYVVKFFITYFILKHYYIWWFTIYRNKIDFFSIFILNSEALLISLINPNSYLGFFFFCRTLKLFHVWYNVFCKEKVFLLLFQLIFLLFLSWWQCLGLPVWC